MNIYKIIHYVYGDIGDQGEVVGIVKAENKEEALAKFYNKINIPLNNYIFTVRELYKEEQDLVDFGKNNEVIKEFWTDE